MAWSWKMTRYFNPRSLHGERPKRLQESRRYIQFQPTLPARERLYSNFAYARYKNFNPRSPHGERPRLTTRSATHPYFNPRSPHGERRIERRFFGCVGKFQPTLPARGATRACSWRLLGVLISTHAPRTGSDRLSIAVVVPAPLFQPTLPARGATRDVRRR